jgi:hypothetical protein
MSRSNPVDTQPNPATTWFEWSGSSGDIRYYDKRDKKNVAVALPFTFILLDQLSTVKGWHDASESGIYANEVKDTRSEPFVVKAFKGGILAEGFYSQIRDRVIAHGGHFTANLYIAYKGETQLDIGSLQFKGAALGAWMEFNKENRADVFKKAVVIDGYNEGKKGQVVFRTPKFRLKEIAEDTNDQATDLDRQLQSYLASYFKRTRIEQATPEQHEPEPEMAMAGATEEEPW